MSINPLLKFSLCPLATALLISCQITEPNISYDACLAGEAPCPEVCNGQDDDRDGSIDEGLNETCVVLTNLSLEPSTFTLGFGQAVATVPDLNGDGFQELLISTSRPPQSIDLESPETGKVALIDGATKEIQWVVEYGGDFGHSIAVGKDESGLDFWCAGAPSKEGDNDYFGRILCLDFEGSVLDSVSAQSEHGLGYWLSMTEGNQGTRLIVSEPLWSGEGGLLSGELRGEERLNAGRISVLKLSGGELTLESELVGSESDQRIGERAIEVGDGNGDGINDMLITGYSNDETGARQVWLVNGAVSGEVSRLKRFSAADETGGSFGASLAHGRFNQGSDQEIIAFGTPYIQSERDGERDLLSRMYFTTLEGESLGTSSARIIEGEDYGIGESVTTISLGGYDLLATAGPGVMRILKLVEGKAEVIHEFDLPRGSSTALASTGKVDPDGSYKIWIGLPMLGVVKQATVRPAMLSAAEGE